MEYTKLGQTGLDVSRICLGCMSYGTSGSRLNPWQLDLEQSRLLIKQAIELGINYFDTANIYSAGESEEITGRVLKELANRDEIVVATKVFGPMRSGQNAMGLSRKAIFNEIDASLRRLGMDYVDLYQIHRWDSRTPIEETMEALHDVVKAGKARYIGASTMYAWQFAKAQTVAERNHWTRFVSMQNYVNLIYREEEREMLPLCKDNGIAVVPWSPLARGKLTRPWDVQTDRGSNDEFGARLYSVMEDANRKVVERVGEIAKARSLPMAQIALAWLLHKPEITAPIVGACKPVHLEDAVAALEVKLSPAEMIALEENYVPHPVMGFA